MSSSHTIESVSEPQLLRLGQELAFIARRGDLLALSGELGAGKTTLARAILRSLIGSEEEIPSPTFTLVQTYVTARMPAAHFDLYRLGAPGELEELGLDPALKSGIAIVEWPERAGALLPGDRLDVRLDDNGAAASRRVTLTGHGSWAQRLDRFMAMRRLIGNGGNGAANGNGCSHELRYLQGDASIRRYGRLARGEAGNAILMDWPRQPDGPPIRNGLPYSRLAHLAEDVRPFVAVANALAAAGLTVPRIHAQDLDNGFLVLDDLGDRVFGSEITGGATDQATLWSAATDALVELRRAPAPQALPVDGNGVHEVASYDTGAMAIETELLIDWYWPALRGAAVPDSERAAFTGAWADVFAELAKLPPGWVLRDYHSPNLLWLPEREGIARVGVIDFQDAMRGPAAYDLVSLLQDARVDVAPELEADLFERYCAGAAAHGAFDREAFAFAYAALGAQRNTKIVGIFARLAKRDGKPGYLQHIPRLWRYLDRDLAHPRLAALRRWYDRNFPADARAIPAA